MAKQPQGGGGGGDSGNSMDLLWGVAFVVAICLLLWYFARGPIITAFFVVKLFEIQIISIFTDDLIPIKEQILAYYNQPKNVTIPQLQFWFGAVGKYMRYPFAAIVVALAAWTFFRHPVLKFKNVFDMNRLRTLEKENWPQITPIASLDLVKEDINEGEWAMGESPMQFAKKYKLLEELPQPIDPLLARMGLIEVKVLEDKARAVFTKQMGPVFEDLNKMPIHIKALFAIFAAKADNNEAASRELLLRIAKSSASGKLDFSGSMALLRQHYNTKPIAKILSQHAYIYSMMSSMLIHARTTGVLASADFLWLKPLDRKLWFILNGTGKTVAFCEVAGPFSHWKAEIALKRKLTQPMVDGAIKGLQEAIKGIIYTRDDD